MAEDHGPHIKRPTTSRHRFVRDGAHMTPSTRRFPRGKCPTCGELFPNSGEAVIHSINVHVDTKAIKLWDRVMNKGNGSVINNAFVTFTIGRYEA